MALDAVKFMRTRTRGSPSWPGSCPQAGYVDADCSDQVAEIACGRGGPYVFKRRSLVFVLGMMARARRQLPESHRAQLPAHRLLRDREPELLPHPLHQIDDAPAHHAMHRRDRAFLDDPAQRRTLTLAKKRRVA